MKKPTLLVLVLASACASVAFAQSTSTPAPAAPATAAAAQRPAHAMRVDANGDGVITRDEASKFPRLAASFDQIDTNKDGKLSADEMKAWRTQQRGERSGRRDGGHRMMTMTPEMQARMQQQRMACFDKADANHDGQLSRDEFAKMHEVCGSMMGHRGQRAPAGTAAPAAPAPAR